MAFRLCKQMTNIGLHDQPAASINKSGELSLTKAAQTLAGIDTAMYVRFFYDRERKLLGLEASDRFLDAAISIKNRKNRGLYQLKTLLIPFGVNIGDIVGVHRVFREQNHNLTIIDLGL